MSFTLYMPAGGITRDEYFDRLQEMIDDMTGKNEQERRAKFERELAEAKAAGPKKTANTEHPVRKASAKEAALNARLDAIEARLFSLGASLEAMHARQALFVTRLAKIEHFMMPNVPGSPTADTGPTPA